MFDWDLHQELIQFQAAQPRRYIIQQEPVYVHRHNKERDLGGPGPPKKEQNWENKEQNGGKKFQNGAFLGYSNS